PHGHYDAKWIDGYYVCSSYSALSPPADGGNSWDIWGMRGTDAGKSSSSGGSSGGCSSYSSSGSGSGSSSSGSYTPPKCTHEEWIEGYATCTLRCDDDAIICGSACTSLYTDPNNC